MPLSGYACGTIAADRFVLLEEIGDGGAACVFRARDLSSAATVALKIAKACDGGTTSNFAREAGALREVHHPNVAGFVAAGTLSDGRAYIAMHYARGRSLRAILRNGPLSLDDVLVLGTVAADALGAIKAAGMIHRDLKPGNIIVPCEGEASRFERAVLIDLGVFGAMHGGPDSEPAHTRWGRVSGTALYMAPEQLAGRAQTAATDAYALGLLLHEAIYGTVPLAHEEVRAWRDPVTGAFLAFTGPLVRRRLVEHVALPAEPHLDPALHDLILELLDPDASCRPARMGDVASLLRELLARQRERR
jgi:serine/threonine-protein kinase